MFTANDARDLMHKTYIENQLNPILNKIRCAAQSGDGCLYVYAYIDDRLNADLVKRGFTVSNIHMSLRDEEFSYVISW